MLSVTEELSDYHSEQANEISPCSELNQFLNMLHVRIFSNPKDDISSFRAQHRKPLFLLEPKVHRPS